VLLLLLLLLWLLLLLLPPPGSEALRHGRVNDIKNARKRGRTLLLKSYLKIE